ncbi:hypothetical protein SAMN05192529_10669 [Arachidicoccus rhizosphaerae]|jgi:hypothetical protein|uniref:Uncharacterized protein n=1 Tax=Arachidicoccus rhizosphaerae TaxID=551991 RepID=A0A1H3XQW7_9BACT|nr:hypothetical protein [Arachidicoccus rhizosphaerae]SEA01917.1 hypothetical protein SAMN05192529_10669 [Arachidicoccus rhizosphaerae]
MYSLLLLICCVGFFCLYNTSQKAKLSGDGSIERWLQSNVGLSRIFGIAAIVISLAGLIVKDGAVMGTMSALLMTMAAGCYIIGLAPFRIIRIQHILALGLFAFLLEILIY